jgi:hypothetical protein
MELKVGDKVKFLDATGGGVVRKIIDSRMVLVAVEGGFEIPTLSSKLLKMETSEPGQRFFNESFDVAHVSEGEKTGEEIDERISAVPEKATKGRKSEDVFLAFVPQDQKWLITGVMDVFLINNTSWDLLYNHFRKEGAENYSGIDYGSMNAGEKLLLASADRESISDWTEGCLQFLFHKANSKYVPPPVNAEFEIQGKKFYTEGSYRESPLIEGKGIVLRIATLEPHYPERKAPGKSGVPGETDSSGELIMKHMTGEKEADVDLHLSALKESGEVQGDMSALEFQKRYFVRALESAIGNKFRKVIFIHGVGEGILRDALLEILKTYGIVEVQDAPLHKYGAGAVEVRIPFNKFPQE